MIDEKDRGDEMAFDLGSDPDRIALIDLHAQGDACRDSCLLGAGRSQPAKGCHEQERQKNWFERHLFLGRFEGKM
jgi:hypothetical protein